MSRFWRLTILSVLALVVGTMPAAAADVAVYPLDYVSSVPAPHTATGVTLADIEGGALFGYDVFLIGHVPAGATDWSAAACTEVSNFLNAGGGVVTEWNGVTFLFSALGGSIYYAMAPPQCGFFAGTVDEGNPSGAAGIDVVNPGSPLMTGLPNPFSMGGGSEFMYTVAGFGPEWTVDATYNGHGGTWPSVMWANYGAGTVVVGTSDYFDVLPGDANATQLIDNMLNFADSGGALVAVDVPTVGSYGLALLAMLMALAGVAVLRAVRS